MKVIYSGEARVKRILPINNISNPRRITCLIEKKVKTGFLLFNLLTRNIVFLKHDEYHTFFSSNYAIENYFTVEATFDEYKTIKTIKSILYKADNDVRCVSDFKFIVFTTLDCNAHCTYCFENGFKNKEYMSNSTALQVAKYITQLANKKKVNITWFGGEPLLNQNAINIICNYLLENNIEFESFVFTNGYLIDENFINHSLTLWNTKGIEVTLDGDEKTYNKVKNFEDKNAFSVVLSNLRKTLSAGLKIIIRINLSLENYDNLLCLLDNLKTIFVDMQNISLHIEKIYTKKQGACLTNSQKVVDNLEIKYREFIELAENKGYSIEINTSWKSLKVTNCYADRAGGRVIFPNGTVGVCEHYINNFLVDSVFKYNFDNKKQSIFCSRMNEIAACSKCILFAECLRMKNCDFHRDTCTEEYKNTILWRINRNLYDEYIRMREND